jgi:hypothetical protein
MNILFVNHSVENCGVYQYGKRVSDILVKSKKYNFVYLELNSQNELDQNIVKYNPAGIVYNYLPGTLPWVNPFTVAHIRAKNIRQYTIIHNSEFHFFDCVLHQNPYHTNLNQSTFCLLRPLFEYTPSKNIKEKNKLQIGTFGFGFYHKNVHDICKLVNDQFDEDVSLNLHLTFAHFGGTDETLQNIKNQCLNSISKKNIELNITTNFLTNQEMLDFLYMNNLNIFFSDKYNFYNGISSSIDYALSVKKPIAVCRSNMFSHIYDVEPSICVENNSLKAIITNGFRPLEEKYNEWSHKNFISRFEEILQKTIQL